MIDQEIFDSPEFKKEFWDWFDNIPREERRKFQEYPADMAELNFYNRVYRHKSGFEAKYHL